MKRRRAEESADGLALMTSSVTSSYSADGLREQSQESAEFQQMLFALINQSQDTSWKHMFKYQLDKHTQATAASSRELHESAVAIHPVASYSASSRELQCYCISSRLGTQTQEKKKYRSVVSSLKLKHPVARYSVAS
ncbi:hypothetical protein F511_14123 [Dorcoceras hygrometricum]|uniref:Uncharacterized protein n=1 Tax=Dorcoceras hygrometricum TaxID=472368 RepID=A0A2Z7D9H2_9LAMI|nr:hypothetical protein F511_14123 [Dorcoceras hygrometricum]